MKTTISVFMTASLMLGAGANGARAEKTIYERGWIGGEYKLAKASRYFHGHDTVAAFPEELKGRQRSGILVANVYPDTPAQQAELEPGDLILSVNGNATGSVQAFLEGVRRTAPGQVFQVELWRRGQILDRKIVVGREAYEKAGTLAVGILLSSRLDLWPNPDFSLFVLGYQRDNHGTELKSPEMEYMRNAKASPQRDDPGTAAADAEPLESETWQSDRWKFWATPFQVSRHLDVLSQECVEPAEEK